MGTDYSSGNTLLTNDEITKATTILLENELKFVAMLDNHSSDFGNKSHQIGDSERIRKPIHSAAGRNGAANLDASWAFSGQKVAEEKVTLILDTVVGRDFNFTNAELSMKIEDFSNIIIKPIVRAIAQDIELSVYTKLMLHLKAYNAATITYDNLVDIGVIQSDDGCPVDARYFAISPKMSGNIRKDIKSLTQASSTLSDAFQKAYIGNIAGYETYESLLLPTITTGATGADRAGTVGGAVTNGASVVTIAALGAGSSTVKAGDVFVVNGVFEVNDVTKAATTNLFQFVCAEDVNLTTGGGVVKTTIPIYYTGALKNCSAQLSNQVITLVGALDSTTYQQGLVFDPSFAGIAFGNLEVPAGSGVTASTQQYKGISMSMVSWFDGTTRVMNYRFDVLFGVVVKESRLARKIVLSA